MPNAVTPSRTTTAIVAMMMPYSITFCARRLAPIQNSPCTCPPGVGSSAGAHLWTMMRTNGARVGWSLCFPKAGVPLVLLLRDLNRVVEGSSCPCLCLDQWPHSLAALPSVPPSAEKQTEPRRRSQTQCSNQPVLA